MPDKIVNHFVLANGSIAKYDAGSLADLDETVSLAGYAPDAKAVDDRLTAQDGRLDSLEADGSVTTEKLADGSVTTAKLADNAITSDKIADGAVQTEDYSNKSVTMVKLGDDVSLYFQYITQLWDALLNGYSLEKPVVAQGALTFSQGDAEFTYIN